MRKICKSRVDESTCANKECFFKKRIAKISFYRLNEQNIFYRLTMEGVYSTIYLSVNPLEKENAQCLLKLD